MALLLDFAVIAVVCAVSCAVARWVGQRVDNGDEERSQRQWQLMCEALGLEDLADGRVRALDPPAGVPEPRASGTRNDADRGGAVVRLPPGVTSVRSVTPMP